MKQFFLIVAILFAESTLASDSGGHGGGGGAGGNFILLESLVINVRTGSHANGFLNFVPQLKLAHPEDMESVKVHMPMLRHILIKSLIGKNADVLQTVAFMNEFSHTAAGLINQALGDEYVKEVLFDRWLVQ